jgi:hypothetical protein
MWPSHHFRFPSLPPALELRRSHTLHQSAARCGPAHLLNGRQEQPGRHGIGRTGGPHARRSPEVPGARALSRPLAATLTPPHAAAATKTEVSSIRSL